MPQSQFTASDKVSEAFLKASREAYEGLEIDFTDSSSQLANAVALVNTLKEFELLPEDMTDEQADLLLQIAYKGGNTSQARQALLPTKKSEASRTIAKNLIAMVK